MGEVVEAVIDLLQESEEMLFDKMSCGKLEAFFLIDGGYEGTFTIELRDVKVDMNEKALIVKADGLNGEAEIKIKFNRKLKS